MTEPTYTPPRLTSEAGRYVVRFETEGVEFAFEQGRTDRRSGDLTSELTVWDTFTGLEIVSGIRVNLTTSRARSDVATALSKQSNRAEWATIVEQAFAFARKAMRVREPAILLRDAEQRESRFLTEPLLTDAGATVLFGDGGTGKSLLALAAAIDLHTGTGDVLGLQPAEAARVLFCDWEWDPAVHRQRMEAMVGGKLPDLAYLRCEASLADETERILATVRHFGSKALVIDSAAWAAGAEPEKSESATGFYLALRRIGLPAIVTAHTPKVGDVSKPFGSVFWHNGARLTWQLAADQSTPDALGRIGLLNRKNNDGRLVAPLGWEVDTTEGITFRRVHPSSIAAVSDRMPIRERAAAYLVAGARTYAEIADEIDEEVRSVRTTIDRDLRDRGERSRFVKLLGDDNVYRIGLRTRMEVAA